MNKKGFTLVELLAVIIILSLLALLASTSVSKIVKDSKSDLYDTQIELIKSAAEAWGADNLYDLPDAGTCKTLTLKDLKQYGLIDPEIKDPRTNKLFSDNLMIKITGEENKYGLNNITYEVDSNDVSTCRAVYPVCTLVKNGDVEPAGISPGDKYQCKVKDNMEEEFENGYYFYVLSTESDGTTNLIMDRNINSDGTPTTKAILESEKDTNGGIYNLVAYNSLGDASDVGPVTVMSFLNNATSTWENIQNLDITYDDEDENFTDFALNGKARLPYHSEVNNVGCLDYENLSCPVWMVDYLYDAGHDFETTYQENPIDRIYGYWTLSSAAHSSNDAWYVLYGGFVNNASVDYVTEYGARPVINLKI